MNSLAELKRNLQVGVKIVLISASSKKGGIGELVEDSTHKGLNKVREVKRIQTNAVQFSDDSWLQFGVAGFYTFTPNGFIYDDTYLDNWGCRLEYQFVKDGEYQND